MIHEIGRELQALIRQDGCPFAVIDGPEATKPTTFGRERIVIERDKQGGDRFDAVRSQHDNPKHRFTRSMGVKLTIYAQSPNTGAVRWEHERRADLVLDHVLCALYRIAKERKNKLAVTGGGFADIEDLADSEVRAGAKYELTFLFDRGVHEKTWTGDARPTGEIGSVKSTTNVTLANGPENQTPVVGCGGEI